MDQVQNANSPISGSLFDRFNRLHTLVPSSLRAERKERQKSVISLSLSLARSREVRYLHGDRVREKHSFLYRQNVLSCPCGSSPRPLSPTPLLFLPLFFSLHPSPPLFPPFGVSSTHTHVHPGGGINSPADIHPRSHQPSTAPRHATPRRLFSFHPTRHLYCLPVV